MNINIHSAVLFDLDGVLVDACNWHYEALNSALIDMKYEPINKKDHIIKYNGLPTLKKLNLLGINQYESNKINNLKQKYTLSIIKNKCKLMTEKIELHNFLKKNNIKIACVTNSIKETAIEMLKLSGQFEFIDLLVTNEDVIKNKPYPDCYNFAVKTLGVDPSACLCVEDSPKGIEAARASCVPNLWVVSNPSDVTLENYKEIVK